MWAGFFKTPKKSSNDQHRNPSTEGEKPGTEQDHLLPTDQKPQVEETSTEPNDSQTAVSDMTHTMEDSGTESIDQFRQQSTEASDSMEEISTEQSDPGPSERKRTINTPAQDKIREELKCINSEILYIMNIKKSCGLSAQLKNKLTNCEKDKAQLEKKLKRKLTDAKAQAKARGKKVAKIETIMTEAGDKIKHTPGRPRLEEKMEGLTEAIYSIVVPEGAADERRRTETINSIKTIDDLKRALEEKGYLLSRSALYYRLIPANVRSNDGKHHFSTVNVKLCRPQNNQRKPHIDGHFASATVKYVKELAGLFGRFNVFFLSQDDKARVPIGLPISKKQSLMRMHLDYKVTLPDHDFPNGENHKLIPYVYACCLPEKDGRIGYSGPTYVAIRSAKHNKSSAESHMADFKQILTVDSFIEHAKIGDEVKPLVFISVDGGPDEAPKNTKTLLIWAATFRELNLDACFIFSHAPGSSAYNRVERRMAPLSKMTAGIVLPFDSFGSHLNASNKTVDTVLERKKIEAAGKILSEVFNETEIDGYSVVSKFVSDVCEEVNDDLDERWKSVHVLQSQYMCQIVKCLDTSCCRPFRTNYAEFFQDRFLPPPVPIQSSAEGLKVDESGHFGSLFQALHINRFVKTDCFDQHCPSLNQPDAKGLTKIQKRTCTRCGKYHSTIKNKTVHMKVCARMTADTDSSMTRMNESESESDDERESNEQVLSEETAPNRNIFESISAFYGMEFCCHKCTY